MSAVNGALAAISGPNSRAVLPQTVPASALPETVGERGWLLATAAVMTAATLLALLPASVRDLRRQS
ncbi:hypothetical protein [Dactylosporangium sp. CA-092794]|uniref:hypothetical protein n=1 Tax=Dactylosporangium sp. CA-092794 TaxID=3239929 RepID=UPI003D8E76D4